MEAKEKKYDVFISCKSEDYKWAKSIYDYLVENNLKVFLADAELRRSGSDVYGAVIDEALEAVDHFILFASKIEYVTSSYVANEWRIFIEEKRSGRKKGNFLTILKGVNVEQLPISLRHYQNFHYSEFKTNLLYYISPSNPISNQHQWEPVVKELSKQVKFLKLFSILSTTVLVICLVCFFVYPSYQNNRLAQDDNNPKLNPTDNPLPSYESLRKDSLNVSKLDSLKFSPVKNT